MVFFDLGRFLKAGAVRLLLRAVVVISGLLFAVASEAHAVSPRGLLEGLSVAPAARQSNELRECRPGQKCIRWRQQTEYDLSEDYAYSRAVYRRNGRLLEDARFLTTGGKSYAIRPARPPLSACADDSRYAPAAELARLWREPYPSLEEERYGRLRRTAAGGYAFRTRGSYYDVNVRGRYRFDAAKRITAFVFRSHGRRKVETVQARATWAYPDSVSSRGVPRPCDD